MHRHGGIRDSNSPSLKIVQPVPTAKPNAVTEVAIFAPSSPVNVVYRNLAIKYFTPKLKGLGKDVRPQQTNNIQPLGALHSKKFVRTKLNANGTRRSSGNFLQHDGRL